MDDKYIKGLIASDAKATADNHDRYPNLALEECCPHQSAEDVYIGDGDTEYTCRHCGYCWVSSNPSYHE